MALADTVVVVPRVKLGSQGFETSAQGLGCAGMAGGYGIVQTQEQSTQVIRHAVERGVTFLDTADMYGPYLNEVMVGKVSLLISGVWRWCFDSLQNLTMAVVLCCVLIILFRRVLF